MRKVELVKGIQSSVLGFGCAPILGSNDAATSRRALELAFEYGVNHFDLARSYGYGEAEKFVGKVLGSKRDKIILTSKFGIVANWKAELLRPLKPIVRLLREPKKKAGENNPGIKKETSVADIFHDRIEITSSAMRKNLEKSLRALKTDYLDYFLIHEPSASIKNMDQLCDTASRLKEEGKIRAWGLAYMKHQAHLHQSYLHRFDVLQFNNSPVDVDYQQIFEERSTSPNIFFSPLRGGPQMTPRQKLEKLLTDFSKTVILCSMYTEKHLKENVQLAS